MINDARYKVVWRWNNTSLVMVTNRILTELNGKEMGCSNTCRNCHNKVSNRRHQALHIRSWGTLLFHVMEIRLQDRLRPCVPELCTIPATPPSAVRGWLPTAQSPVKYAREMP